MHHLLFAAAMILAAASCSNDVLSYVNPAIGTQGMGNIVIGPCRPFSMVRPSPDCTTSSNSGYRPMPERVDGFAQVHVSGTGGNPKYGNILIMPFIEGENSPTHYALRCDETAKTGYYRTTFDESGITSEITCASRASCYRFTFAQNGSVRGLEVDAGFCLGVSDTEETQIFEDGEVKILSPREVEGWSRVRGGWNMGTAYTVYFYLRTNRDIIGHIDSEHESNLLFDPSTDKLNVNIGISFLSEEKAEENLNKEIGGKDFDTVRKECEDSWRELLSGVSVSGKTPAKYRTMLYTALYHSFIMPTDRTGEWDKCSEQESYFDDFYTIWDTFRCNMPLITLLRPNDQARIVNSLLTIYKHDGYLPDGRSGNCNGRTQSGSNAEIVIADAFVKGLEGIDWELALEAMIKDAQTAPANDLMEGRGSLQEYNTLGYIPGARARSGSRTVDYSLCDYAIATVAAGLGHKELADKYMKRSSNWKNLWREDCTDDGVSGFIMPRDAQGNWLDVLPFGHSRLRTPTYTITPQITEGAWYVHHWDRFFYEATSWETSLSVPHDVPGLIEMCGGPEAFRERLDKFFDKGYFNVNNEPSFFHSCLYHWIGRPDLTSDRVAQIIEENFNDTGLGLPGNDDSGAMSSWLAFHLMGLYPNAGTSEYVLHSPLVPRTTIRLSGGKKFTIMARGLSRERRYIESMTLNGKPYDKWFISHKDILEGGTLVMKMSAKSPFGGSSIRPRPKKPAPITARAVKPLSDTLTVKFHVHDQRRTLKVVFGHCADSLCMNWTMYRKMTTSSGCYIMAPGAVESASWLTHLMPEDGNVAIFNDATFCVLPGEVFDTLKSGGRTAFNGTQYVLSGTDGEALGRPLLHISDIKEGAELWVVDNRDLPVIWRMHNNPDEIDWTFL